MRLTTLTSVLLLGGMLAACSDTGPIVRPYLTIASPTTISDTTNAKVVDLVAQVRDSTGKTSYPNLTLFFVADAVQGPSGSVPIAVFTDADGHVFSAGHVYTDAHGRVALKMQLGSAPGSGIITISMQGANTAQTVNVTVLAPPAPHP